MAKIPATTVVVAPAATKNKNWHITNGRSRLALRCRAGATPKLFSIHFRYTQNMRVLCIFAHPDDESAGIGGTIARLTQAGHDVHIVSATDGNGGECMEQARHKLTEHHNHLGSLRREELLRACDILGASCEILEFEDGHITNEDVWGKLTLRFIALIDQYQPDILITFDHTGWYYHLDHVGVSIATMFAAQQATFQNFALVLSHVKMSSTRWRYCFPDILPTTHSVSVEPVTKEKSEAMDAHASQNLESAQQRLKDGSFCLELFQLVWCKNQEAQKLFDSNIIFTTME
jgi:LmbE family N-acetylglucosaminyl deacetylase